MIGGSLYILPITGVELWVAKLQKGEQIWMCSGAPKDCSKIWILRSPPKSAQNGLWLISENVQARVASAAKPTKGELTPVWCEPPENRKRKHSHIVQGPHSSIIAIDKDNCERRNVLPMSPMKTDSRIKSDIPTSWVQPKMRRLMPHNHIRFLSRM